MKRLGLVGGTSWVSTIEYYRKLNEGINQRLGQLNFAECVIFSFNYQHFKENLDKGDWETNTKLVVAACQDLEKAGADGILLCANTTHFIADEVQKQIDLPIIHIGTSAGKEISKTGKKKVGLLGTKFTMEYDYYTNRIEEYGVNVIVPESEEERNLVNERIFSELIKGIFTDDTKQQYLAMIERMKERGAEGFIAGCTEIPLIIKPEDIDLMYFDAMELHCKDAIEFALS